MAERKPLVRINGEIQQISDVDRLTDVAYLDDIKGKAGFTMYTAPGIYNFTVPVGVTKIYAEVLGAGGGGAAYNSSHSAGAAGGSSSVGTLLSAGGGGGGNKSSVASAGSVSGSNIDKPLLFTSADGGTTGIGGSPGMGGASPYGTGGAIYSSTSTAGSGGNGGTGAGGGGARNLGDAASSRGGAAGGFGCGVYDVTPGTTITITVGSGGVGGNRNNWKGGTGGNGFVKLWWC